MAKKKIGRALAGLAALGTMGALAARKSSRANEERVRSMSPAPPAPMREREPLRKLNDEFELRIQEDRMARGVPAVTDEEQAEVMHDIKGVRDSSGIPIRAGDGVLEESNPSMRSPRAQTPTRFMVDTPLEMKHFLGRDLSTLNPRDYKKGGEVKRRSSVSSASKRGDGIAIRGKTKGRLL